MNATNNKPKVWMESFRVRSYELDPGQRASIVTICNYLQEAAGNHAAALGVSIEQLSEQDLTWVLARLRVEMDIYPSWRDEVIVKTWPSGVDRLFAMREFLIMDDKRSEIGRGSSAWLLIDRIRRRPIRLPEFITSLELADLEKPIASIPDSLPEASNSADAVSQSVRIRYADLDVNGHVNNVRYAEWSIEGISRHLHESCVVRALDLHFRAEGSYGDPVEVRTAPVGSESNSTFVHAVISADRELARARTVWTPA